MKREQGGKKVVSVLSYRQKCQDKSAGFQVNFLVTVDEAFRWPL